MLPIKLTNLSSKLFIVLGFLFLFDSKEIKAESVDLWKKEKKEIKENKKKESIKEEKSKIDFSKKDKNLGQIEIVNSNDNLKEIEELVGLYDPEKNDLSLAMWANTNGEIIKGTFERIR